MKKLLILSALVLTQTGLMAQTKLEANATPKKEAVSHDPSHWAIDPVHSSVKFSVSHMTISEVEGSFKKFDGYIQSQAPDFNNAKIRFTVDVNSITTDNDMRDKHLKSDDFFNAEKYPDISFVSTSFKKVKGSVYVLEGNLTIRDVTKKVKLAVMYGGTIKDPMGSVRAGFKASGKISRKDFGLKWNKLTEAGGAVVGDEVTMMVNVEFTQK